MINDKEVPKTVMKMLFKTCCNRCKIHTKNASRQPHAIVSSIPHNKTPFYGKTFHNSQAPKAPFLYALMTCVEEGGAFFISLRELPLFKLPPRPIRPISFCKNHAKKCLHNSESSRARQNIVRCKKYAKKD